MKTVLSPVWRPGSLKGTDSIAEAVAAKDLNNLYRTSCYFADRERYRAFCAFYAVMRIVDDEVDDLLARGTASSAHRHNTRLSVVSWKRAVSAAVAGGGGTAGSPSFPDYPHSPELIESLRAAAKRFPIPALLWDNFFSAMLRELEENRFASYVEFLNYAEGAAVAPTTIYLYLISAERLDETGPYVPPPAFDLVRCGRDLGRFAYLAHVLRDLATDLDQGLLYLAADDMARHDVTEDMLHAGRIAERASPEVCALVADLVGRARGHLKRGRAELATLRDPEPDRGFVLRLIVRIYDRILDKITACSYDIMSDRHRLTGAEKDRIAFALATKMGLATP